MSNRIEHINYEQKKSDLQAKITLIKERVENVTTTHKTLSDHYKPKLIIMIFTKSAIPSFYVDPKFQGIIAEENSKQIVQNLFRLHLILNTEPSNICIVRRLGRQPATSPDKRNIIFKLCRRDTAIWQAVPKLGRTTGLVRQRLANPLRNKVFYDIRMLKKRFPQKKDILLAI